MYDELVKNLRSRRICVQSGGDLEKDFQLMREAAEGNPDKSGMSRRGGAQKVRIRTFSGIAKAMAEQCGVM